MKSPDKSIDQLPIFQRVHTVKEGKSAPKERQFKSDKDVLIWPEYALIFDTETRTTVDQTLMFGVYRICKLVGGTYRCEKEGIIYDDGLSDESLNTIGTFVLNNFAETEVKQFPPRIRFDVHQSHSAFMERVFFPALRKGWLICGFNLPFDLSRLSVDWHRTREDGFALVMSRSFWRKHKRWVNNPYRPKIRIKAKDARTAFIKASKTKKPKEWPNPMRPLDVSTLLFALFDEHRSMRDWCRYFRDERGYTWVHEKLDHEPSGQVTLEELNYCRNDVRCTQDLLNCAKQEFDLYAIPDLLPDKAYSPASLGKGSFRAIGIVPPAQKFGIQDELNGIFMEGYFGGRAESHIRKISVPIMKLDFLSQYPTVNTLQGNWEILTAESVKFPECTDEIREFLKTVTPDKCYEPSFWRELRFFALVQPNEDIFPVRAPYSSDNRDRLNIGVNFLTSEKPVWFAGPDIIAAIILSDGKIPKIERAVRIVPQGQQPGMKPFKIRGVIEVDPYRDDLFKILIEQRYANKSDKTLYKALKVIANSTAYGAFVELNEQREPEPVELAVFSGQHQHTQSVRDVEVPGKWYFPPLANLITSGGRLLLAMAEAALTAAGGTYMACDTDSIMAVVSPQGGMVPGARRPLIEVEGNMNLKATEPIHSLSHETVKKIAQRFRSLNPYSFGGDLLKIEDVNYVQDAKGKPTNVLRTVHGFAISAKRYALSGGEKIVEAKGHGLGYLMSPTSKKGEDWIMEAWEYVLQVDTGRSDNAGPEWLDYPAMLKIPVSSPAVLGRLKGYCKPYDFVLSPIIREDELDWRNQVEKPILITRFTKNPKEWEMATYSDVRTGEIFGITTGAGQDLRTVPVMTYRQILHRYLYNPESKFNGLEGNPCDPWTRGVLQRRHITAGPFQYCGKEFKRKLEQGPVDHDVDFKVKIYANGKISAEPEALRILAKYSEREISKQTGLSRHTIRLIRRGKPVKKVTFQLIDHFLNGKEEQRQRL